MTMFINNDEEKKMTYCIKCGQAEYHPPGTCPYDDEELGRPKIISDSRSNAAMNFFSDAASRGEEIKKRAFESENLDI
ncbi:MAG: hypothetical protein WCT49_02245 [Candidatus Paceibacterota bacterium]|jgi:hypothetical protein|nr:hypothetical protein [Candidatus Paceibacterota bacterium]